MRILLITPSAFPSLTGNAITTERWRRSLTGRGLDIQIVSAHASDLASLEQSFQSFHPDLIHVYHAFKAGALFLRFWEKTKCSLPLVLSPGGTDINLDLESPAKHESILQIMRMARVIVGQSPEIMQKIRDFVPEVSPKLISVPKACSWFGAEPLDLREHIHCAPDTILFFLPAGIRPVKRNVECLQSMVTVHSLRPQTRFVAAGPAIDNAYALQFESEIKRQSAFAFWLGAIPPARMHAAYASSDIVLNASLSEGLSNSLLEAMVAGKPFLASDIPGNRHPFFQEDGIDNSGCYFDLHSPADFVEKAVRLIDDAEIRKTLAEAACQRALKLASPENEADGLIHAYQIALNEP